MLNIIECHQAISSPWSSYLEPLLRRRVCPLEFQVFNPLQDSEVLDKFIPQLNTCHIVTVWPCPSTGKEFPRVLSTKNKQPLQLILLRTRTIIQIINPILSPTTLLQNPDRTEAAHLHPGIFILFRADNQATARLQARRQAIRLKRCGECTTVLRPASSWLPERLAESDLRLPNPWGAMYVVTPVYCGLGLTSTTGVNTVFCPCIVFGHTAARVQDPTLSNYDTVNHDVGLSLCLSATLVWRANTTSVFHMGRHFPLLSSMDVSSTSSPSSSLPLRHFRRLLTGGIQLLNGQALRNQKHIRSERRWSRGLSDE